MDLDKGADFDLLRLDAVYAELAGGGRMEEADEEAFVRVVEALEPCLLSPYSAAREAALSICSAVERQIAATTSEEAASVFELCQLVESAGLTLDTYRDRALHLRNLSYVRLFKAECEGAVAECKKKWHERFTLLWPTVAEVVESYARGWPGSAFFEFYARLLEQTGATSAPSESLRELCAADEGQLAPDWRAFRLQLWRALGKLADVAQTKTRFLSPSLLRLVQLEYEGFDKGGDVTEDLSRVGDDGVQSAAADDGADEEGSRGAVRRLLLAALQAFAAFADGNTVAQSAALRQVYLNLLLNPDGHIQKLAMNCLYTYRHKYLLNYRDSVDRLLDDKTFADEIVRFQVSGDNCVVEVSHRADLMPILMRALYGRLLARVSGSGSAALTRRNAVFRFLASCQTGEIETFLMLLFRQLDNWTENSDMEVMLSRIKSGFDLKRAVPLKQLQSVLRNVGHVLKKLAPFLDTFVGLSLRLCLAVAQYTRLIFDQRPSVDARFYKRLRNIRLLVTQRIVDFFVAYPRYSFDGAELNALFDVWVWPQCDTLAADVNLTTPSGVLRLFRCWTEIPRYHCLLNATDEACTRTTLLHGSLALLNSGHCNAAIQDFVLDGVGRLLNAETPDEGDPSLPVCQAPLPSNRDAPISDYGVRLVLQQAAPLLQFMARLLSARSKASLRQRNFHILERLSAFVFDAELSAALLAALLPCVEKHLLRSELIRAAALRASAALVRHVDSPITYLPRLAPLFSYRLGAAARKELCAVLRGVADKQDACGRPSALLHHVLQLNAWDAKYFDEPDYGARFDAFAALSTLLKSDAVSTGGDVCSEKDALLLLFHNFAFTIANVDDISLREKSTDTLELLVAYLSRSQLPANFTSTFLKQHAFVAVRRGFKADAETVRHEFVKLLRSLVVHLGDSQPKLAGMSALLAPADDAELDFFDNVRHVQAHRRARAMRRLADRLDEQWRDGIEPRPSPDALRLFVLPLATPYVLDAAITSKSSALGETATRLVGAVSRLLAWKHFFALLRQALTRLMTDLSRQKALVRFLCAILDGFHFKIAKPTDGDDDETATTVVGRQVYSDLTKHVLPRLRECLRRQNPSDALHKQATAGRHYDEDDDLLRAPVALAMVKLLQKLPPPLLDDELPSVLLKVCQLLRSRSLDVRSTTRKILTAIAIELGPKYLPYTIKEMRAVLARGYQVHVCIYTMHVLLSELSSQLMVGGVEHCLTDIVEVCNEELFGLVSEEKDADAVTKKLMEAKVKRTNETYELLGRFANAACLNLVVAPLREVLLRKQSGKTSQRVGAALRSFALGMCQSGRIDFETALVFAHQILADNMEMLFAPSRQPADEGQSVGGGGGGRVGRRPPSTYLLPSEPGRSGALPKTSPRSSAHVFVEFGLQLVGTLLKSDKVPGNASALFDPFVPLLARCLRSKYDKVVANGLRCLAALLKYPLPALESSMKAIVEQLFVLLSENTGMGAAGAKGDAFEQATMLFKILTAVIRDADYYDMSDKQLRVLVHYLSESVFDSQKQSTAFALLKAVLARKLVCEEIKPLIGELRQLVVTSPAAHVRVQCRQIIIYYLSAYPLGRKIRADVEFYLTQLDYALEEGRVSVLEMLSLIICRLPQEKVEPYAALCLLHLSSRIVRETPGSKCASLLPAVIRQLLSNVSVEERDRLLELVDGWLRADQVAHVRIACAVVEQYAHVEGAKFERRLPTLLPAVCARLEALVVVGADSSAVAPLSLLASLARQLPAATAKYAAALDGVWRSMRPLLRCVDDVDVALAAARLCGQLFAAADADAPTLPAELARSLCEDCCWLLRARDLRSDVADQAVKNLVFLAQSMSAGSDAAKCLPFLLGDLTKICRWEIAKNSKSTVKRSAIFKFAAAVLISANADLLEKIVDAFLPQFYREMVAERDNDADLKQLATEACELVKERVGADEYASRMAVCKAATAEKRRSRRKRMAEEIVVDPVVAAQKKQRRQRSRLKSRKRALVIDTSIPKKRAR